MNGVLKGAQDSVQGTEDERPLAFPAPPWILPEYIPEPQVDLASFEPPTFRFLGLTRAEALNFAGPSSENRLRWVELLRDPFDGSAIVQSSCSQNRLQDPQRLKASRSSPVHLVPAGEQAL